LFTIIKHITKFFRKDLMILEAVTFSHDKVLQSLFSS
jgi:hypothetical protein